MQYIVVKANGPEQLTEAVQSKIAEGWVPQGGPCVANASNYIFIQAMVLKES